MFLTLISKYYNPKQAEMYSPQSEDCEVDRSTPQDPKKKIVQRAFISEMVISTFALITCMVLLIKMNAFSKPNAIKIGCSTTIALIGCNLIFAGSQMYQKRKDIDSVLRNDYIEKV